MYLLALIGVFCLFDSSVLCLFDSSVLRPSLESVGLWRERELYTGSYENQFWLRMHGGFHLRLDLRLVGTLVCWHFDFERHFCRERAE